MACEDVSARMMELLYEELPEGERAAIRAHLDSDAGGCDRCRRELADLQRVRAQARQVLDEAPPARAHAAILRAAEVAAAVRASAVRAAPPPSMSWWDRLRSRWTFPTLATIGAVAIVLFASRIFLEPEKTYLRGRQGLAPAPAEAPAAETPAAETTPAKEAPVGGGFDLPSGAPPIPHRRAIPAPSSDKAAKRETTEAGKASRIHPAIRVERSEASEQLQKDGLDRSFAPPPPARIGHPAPAAPAALAKKIVVPTDDLEGGDDNGSGGGVRTGSATTANAAGARAKAAPRPTEAEEEAAPAAAPPASAPRVRSSKAADSAEQPLEDADEASAPAREESRRNETPVARADRLFAAGRWVEAVGAYRELLQRYPKNPDAPRWRQRLAAALAALDR